MEIVIYTIHSGKEKAFLEVYGYIRMEMGALPGFVSAETLRSLDKKNTYIDLWTWESEELAKEAHARFAALPHAKQFIAVVEKTVYSGHFVPCL